MDNDVDTRLSSAESESLKKSILIDAILNLQNVAVKRDLVSRTYRSAQLQTLEVSELSMLRETLHEVLYAPPARR